MSFSLYPCNWFNQHLLKGYYELGIKDTRKCRGWLYQAFLQQELDLELDFEGYVEFSKGQKMGNSILRSGKSKCQGKWLWKGRVPPGKWETLQCGRITRLIVRSVEAWSQGDRFPALCPSHLNKLSFQYNKWIFHSQESICHVPLKRTLLI